MSNKASPSLFAKLSAQPVFTYSGSRAASSRESNVPINNKGFTLIELLVVIAIISLLISILLPSLIAAKEISREIVCVSNLRQIGMAWHLYLVDNDDTFPKWRGNMHWFYGGKHPAIANKESNMLRFRPLNPYVDMKLQNEAGVGLFRCSMDRAIVFPGQPSATEGYDTYDYFGNSYMMNHILLKAWDNVTGMSKPGAFQMRDVEISNSLVALAADCQWYYSVSNTMWDAHFHNYDDRVGMVFLDGHAGFIQIIRGESVTEDYSFWMYEIFEEEEQE